jgi:hypothetical protein
MKKIWLLSGGSVPSDWDITFRSFIDYDPDEVIILSNTEVYLESIWGKFLDFVQPWLEEKNKIGHVITPHLDNIWIRPNILTEKSYSMVESAWPLFKNLSIDDFKYSKVYSSYMFRSDEARGRLLDTIIKHDILEEGYVTYHDTDNMVYDGFNYWKKDPIVIEGENYSKSNLEHFKFPTYYRNSFIDIIPETSFFPGLFFLTEKTIRAIYHEKPFMTIGPKGFHKEYLRGYFGLELYDEIIDYSFDDLESLQDRIDGILDNLLYFIENKSRLTDIYRSVKPKVMKNKICLKNIYDDPMRIIPRCLQPLLDKTYDYTIDGHWQVSMIGLINKYRS